MESKTENSLISYTRNTALEFRDFEFNDGMRILIGNEVLEMAKDADTDHQTETAQSLATKLSTLRQYLHENILELIDQKGMPDMSTTPQYELDEIGIGEYLIIDPSSQNNRERILGKVTQKLEDMLGRRLALKITGTPWKRNGQVHNEDPIESFERTRKLHKSFLEGDFTPEQKARLDVAQAHGAIHLPISDTEYIDIMLLERVEGAEFELSRGKGNREVVTTDIYDNLFYSFQVEDRNITELGEKIQEQLATNEELIVDFSGRNLLKDSNDKVYIIDQNPPMP